ncbi:MAG: hypothetical protein ACK4KW_12900 [Gemmobacter sp.]
MIRIPGTAVLAAVILQISGTAASAGVIGDACLASERSQGNRALCACIQQAADMTLDRADQRRAARFFSDPHQAQEVRMSRSDADNAFWARYRSFGEAAEALCARS